MAGRLEAALAWGAAGPADDPARAERFHTELAELAGDPVLTLFLRIVTELFRRHPSERPTPGAGAIDEYAAHRLILAAIVAGDEGLARHRMRRHLRALTPGRP